MAAAVAVALGLGSALWTLKRSCDAGWGSAAMRGKLLVWRVVREGPDDFLLDGPLPVAEHGTRHTDQPQANLIVLVTVSVCSPGWARHGVTEMRTRPEYADLGDRTQWTISVVPEPAAQALRWSTPGGAWELPEEELPALLRAVARAVRRPATLEQCAFLKLPPDDVYTLDVGTWVNRKTCIPDTAGAVRAGGLGALGGLTLVGLWGGVARARTRRAIARGHCPWCRHPLHGGVCLECGTVFTGDDFDRPAKRRNGRAPS